MFKGEITIFEGKKHEVKRILKGLGCYVLYLERIQIGNLKLDKNLKRGDIKVLTDKEIKKIKA